MKTTTGNNTLFNRSCNSTGEFDCSTNVSQGTEITSVSVISIAHFTQVTIGTFGIISNVVVIVIFASNKSYRRKIPVMFMTNQVRVFSSSDLFADLCRAPVDVKHNRHPEHFSCVQHFLHENGVQFCSYLVCRFVLIKDNAPVKNLIK